MSTPVQGTPARAVGRRSGREAVREALAGYGLQSAMCLIGFLYLAQTSATLDFTSTAFSTLEGFTLLGLVGLGIGITMLAGELDLSVASVAVVGGIVAVRCAPLGLVPCLLIAAAAGTLIGVMQGWVIAKTQISSVVLTVGTLILIRGVAHLITDSKAVMLSHFEVSDPLSYRWGIVSSASLISIVLFVVVGLSLARTRYGREIYAIGGARKEALTAGVPYGRPVVVAFGISATLASLGGAVASLRGGSAAPTNFETLLLVAASAALVGGISLHGGKGTVINIALGVLVLTLATVGLADRGAQAYAVSLVTGVLLLFIVTLEVATQHVKSRRRSAARFAAALQRSEPRTGTA